MKEIITLRYCQKCKKHTLQIQNAPHVEDIWQNATHLVDGAKIKDYNPWYCPNCGKIWIPCEPIKSPDFDTELARVE